MPEDVELNISIDASDMTTQHLEDILEALKEVYDIGVVDLELVHSYLYSCIDCGSVVSTNSVLKKTKDEPTWEVHGDDVDPDRLDRLSEPCQVCGANAYSEISFELQEAADD